MANKDKQQNQGQRESSPSRKHQVDDAETGKSELGRIGTESNRQGGQATNQHGQETGLGNKAPGHNK